MLFPIPILKSQPPEASKRGRGRLYQARRKTFGHLKKGVFWFDILTLFVMYKDPTGQYLVSNPHPQKTASRPLGASKRGEALSGQKKTFGHLKKGVFWFDILTIFVMYKDKRVSKISDMDKNDSA